MRKATAILSLLTAATVMTGASSAIAAISPLGSTSEHLEATVEATGQTSVLPALEAGAPEATPPDLTAAIREIVDTISPVGLAMAAVPHDHSVQIAFFQNVYSMCLEEGDSVGPTEHVNGGFSAGGQSIVHTCAWANPIYGHPEIRLLVGQASCYGCYVGE